MIAAFIPLIGSVIERLFPDPKEAANAKLKVMEMQMTGELEVLKQSGTIITAESSSEHWLVAAWRPMVMLTFTGLIVARWFGLTTEQITPELESQLFDIIKIGIGGYVIGRSVEKSVKHHTLSKTN